MISTWVCEDRGAWHHNVHGGGTKKGDNKGWRSSVNVGIRGSTLISPYHVTTSSYKNAKESYVKMCLPSHSQRFSQKKLIFYKQVAIIISQTTWKLMFLFLRVLSLHELTIMAHHNFLSFVDIKVCLVGYALFSLFPLAFNL